ncbi:serine hydrolase domain-containing protein [Winogradskyella sp.]|uniref:serine hydrolase domain-containing protein n=1 Tax=Winogradskyella sp. TaxID=1883156 RepID=UPI003BAABA6F
MKKTDFLFILFISQTLFCFAQNTSDAAYALLHSLIKDEKVMGAAAAFSVNGDIVWESAVGFSDDTKVFTIDTEVRTASIAKSMTAVAIMQLVEQGLIDINLPVDHYLPEFVQKGKAKITTAHLLSHTSGIDAYKNSKETENKINYPTLQDAYEVFKNRKLRFEPGTEFYYTTYGYVVLGLLIEKVSGLSYEDYMQKHIWDKVNMEHTGIENPEVKRENASILYRRDRKGNIKKSKVNNLSNRIPGGGFYSTIGDLIKFGNALLNHTLVTKATLELMIEHHSLEKVNNGYGFGFFLYGKQPNEGSIYGHSGAQTGSSTQFFVIPSLKTVTVAISNTSGASRDISAVAGQLIDISQQED